MSQDKIPVSKEERLAALKKKSREFNTKFDIAGISTGDQLTAWKRASFGIKEIDDLIGGGIPHGNFTTGWGGPGSGKSTLGHLLTAQAQREGKIVYWIALEPYDPIRAKKFGVNLDELIIGQFPQAEQSLDTIIGYARDKLVDVIVVDSIHSLSPKGEQEDKKGDKSVGDDTMALLARKLSQFFKMAIDPIKRAEIAVFLIGQTRMNLGGFIPIEALTGGNALHHYSKLIMRIRRGQGANAPVEKVPTGGKTKGGNDSMESVKIGFESVIRNDKVQVPFAKPEGSELHLPFYFESGYDLPVKVKEEIEAEEKEIAAQFQETDEYKYDPTKKTINIETPRPEDIVNLVPKPKRGPKPGSKRKKNV